MVVHSFSVPSLLHHFLLLFFFTLLPSSLSSLVCSLLSFTSDTKQGIYWAKFMYFKEYPPTPPNCPVLQIVKTFKLIIIAQRVFTTERNSDVWSATSEISITRNCHESLQIYWQTVMHVSGFMYMKQSYRIISHHFTLLPWCQFRW